MVLKMGLLGSGIVRSRMPRFQKYLGALTDIDVDYVLIDGEGLTCFNPIEQVRQAMEAGFYGLNVTHPYKQQVYEIVTRPFLSGHEKIGSYNTLVFEDGNISGANTDYSGFVRGFRYRLGNDSPGSVFLCGAGGVGRAIAFALADLGCTHISIYDVVNEQAQSLASALGDQGGSAKAVEYPELYGAITSSDGLVNCTSLGMYNNPGSAISPSLIGPQKWAFDAVYTPLETEFISRCRTAGLQCLSGFDLWFFQGLDAFKIFAGTEISVTESLIQTTLRWLD